MVYWDAIYRVTTPLFLGGANEGKNAAELRSPSIKGLMRFWFRAIALPILHSQAEVKRLESEIFGSTERQSSFLLTITNQNKLTEVKNADWRSYHGLCYLGFGPVNHQGKALRPYFEPNSCMELRVLAKKGAPKDTAFFLPLTLRALGLFGAAGARSRKGFGSLSLESLTCNSKAIWNPPTSLEELENQLRAFLEETKLDKSDGALPGYTAFSNHSRIWIANTGVDATKLLNEIGIEMLHYRSYGHKNNMGKHVLPDGSNAEQHFADDHDLILDFLHGKQINIHPRRVVFGLPHNYFFKSVGKVDIKPTGKNFNRRASPLFIHIHALGQQKYAAIVSLLPAIFIPPEEKIEISARQRGRKLVNSNVDYSNIANFMNQPAFKQSKVVIWP